MYKINHAIVDVPFKVDRTVQSFAIGVRSSFSHRRSKYEWMGETPPIVVCSPISNAAAANPLDSFQALFLSCSDVWDNTISTKYDDPMQYMRSAGWPCKDEHSHDVTNSWTRRHVLEGYVILPDTAGEQAAMAIQSKFMECHLRSTRVEKTISEDLNDNLNDNLNNDLNNDLNNNDLNPNNNNPNNNDSNNDDLNLDLSDNLLLQQIQLITSGASREIILNASHDYVTSKMADLKLIERARERTHAPMSAMKKIFTFMETDEWMTAAPPGTKQILGPVVDGVMKPVVNVVAQQVGPELSAPLTEDMAHGLNEELPGDVAAMLEQTLTANLTNLLTDSITMRLADSLTTSLTDELGTYLDTSITDAAQPRLHTALHNILSETIPKRLNRDVPTLLIRSLKIGLVQTLTRTVTHSLVPSLALSLTHNKHQDYFCYVCFHYHLYCRLCHYSPQSTYYLQYYSGYYSDYFATFYADYYTQALINIDTLEHPLSHWKGQATDHWEKEDNGAEKGKGYAITTEKGKILEKRENSRDRKMPQHTSLNENMLKVKNGEMLGRKQNEISPGEMNHKGVGG